MSRLGFREKRGWPYFSAVALVIFSTLSNQPTVSLAKERVTWRTMQTEHFDVHFPSGGYEMALRTAGYLEAAHQKLVPLLGHEPRLRPQVVLTDDVDFANGSARVVPYPLIRGFMSPPNADSFLGDYDDFLWLLMVHEYAHVLHLDNAGGVPELGNRLFGRQFTPNHVAPKWLIEGIAVWFESTLSAGGRNDSSLTEMVLRAQVLEDGTLWPIDRVSGAPASWPAGNSWYLFGGRFLAHLAATRGEAIVVDFPRYYGARLLPYRLNSSARRSIGISFNEAWDEWVLAEAGEHGEVISRLRLEGVVEGERFTDLGRSMGWPRYDPADGSILALTASGRESPTLRRFAGTGQRKYDPGMVVRRTIGAQGFDLSPDGAWSVLAIRSPHEIEQSYDDLFAVPVAGGKAIRLTRGLRARDPALSLDGGRLAFVSRRRGETAIYVASLKLEDSLNGARSVLLGEPVRVFGSAGRHVQRPSFSPDGEKIVLTVSRAGPGSDLVLLDLSRLELPPPSTRITSAGADGDLRVSERPDMGPGYEAKSVPHRRLTNCGSHDIHPVFDSTGERVFFSSNRSGVFDVYTLEFGETCAAEDLIQRITRTLTGAFEPRPSPDGQELVYVTYTSQGYDLARMKLREDEWMEAPPPLADRESMAPTPAQVHPVRAYRPWASLRPFSWTPTFGADLLGSTIGVASSGADAVGHHAWWASLWLGVGSWRPGFGARYTWRELPVALSLSSALTEYVSSSYHIREGALRPYEERSFRVTGGAELGLPSNVRRHGFSLALTLDRRTILGGLPPIDPGEPVPSMPSDGLATRARVSWTSSSVRWHPYLHAPSEGMRSRLALDLAARELGGDFRYALVTAGLNLHSLLPFSKQHILTAGFDVGIGAGDYGGRSFFVLGGLPAADPLSLALNRASLPSTAIIRGYPPRSIPGSGFASCSLEHRFHLLSLERGVKTLPFFLRRLHGAFFTDLALVARDLSRPMAAGAYAGVGVEARADILLGYYLDTHLRLGVAHGLGEYGVTAPFLGLGSSF